MNNKTFRVNNMKCKHCEDRVYNALMKLKGVKEVIIKLEEKIVAIEYDDELTTEELLIDIIEDEGIQVIQ